MSRLLRKLYYLLPPKPRRVFRRLFFLPIDLTEGLLKKRTPLVPPRGKIFVGQGDFVEIGDTLLQHFQSFCHLQPHQRVLDVGCGIGRIARPLAGFLNEKGSYEGFDIVKEGINWCQKHYAPYPNFRFLYTPLQNDLYNLSTDQKASDFTFPYGENEFDLVVLTSVFTHMQPADVAHYLKEIGRVMKPGGHCFATFFIITPASEKHLDEAESPFFAHRYGHYFLHNPRVKDANIAYRHEYLAGLFSDAGLEQLQFHPGWWAGLPKEQCINFQDVVILRK
jgi:ubiquinone/menaquinone biosynthesis C-methylase UbiE